MAAALSHLARYQAGEHEQVWAELTALGVAVREPPLYDDAWSVAQETMRRVRHNIEILIPRLEALGYTFGYDWYGPNFPKGLMAPLFSPPMPNITKSIAEIERTAGTLPLSLRAFYEVVGGVNFVGAPPAAWERWGHIPDGLDALYVLPAEVALDGGILPWEEEFGDADGEPEDDLIEDDASDIHAYLAAPAEPNDCWLIEIAPDEYLKYNCGGGGAYQLALPAIGADARLLRERHRTTFVSYLRHCFRWGGLPKLEAVADIPDAASTIAALIEGLAPL
jgi:hypothetical protein